MANSRFDQLTIKLAVLEILDATGISQLPKEERDKLEKDIEQQLHAAVAIELMNSLNQANKDNLAEALKNGEVDQVFKILSENVQDPEEKANRAVEISTKKFLEQYFSRLPPSS
ncbi:hypothetical protein HY635_00600 [Candidatus Uhrbacteria bacterium]|nr:hypothetical protein [Candidatus Uhrbacteria bacterium]